MVKAIDNITTDAPLRDIRLAIGPAEALAGNGNGDRHEDAEPPPQGPSIEEQLADVHDKAFAAGRAEAMAEYEQKLAEMHRELEETHQHAVGKLLESVETNVRSSMDNHLTSLEGELVDFAAEAAIRLVNGLPISAEILEAAIRDALDHCEHDVEVSVHLHPEDLKLLQESGSELLTDSPHQRRVRYLKNDEITRGGCLVETRCGLIDGSRETREKLLRATVAA